MCFCHKCSAFVGMLTIVFGLLFLLRDLNVWNFWNIQWWTAVFLLAGFGMFFSSGCPDCTGIKQIKKKK